MSSTFPISPLIISFHFIMLEFYDKSWLIIFLTTLCVCIHVYMHLCICTLFILVHCVAILKCANKDGVFKFLWRLAFILYFEVYASRTLLYYLKQRNIFNLQRLLQQKMQYARIHLQTQLRYKKIFFVSIVPVAAAAAAVFAEQRK